MQDDLSNWVIHEEVSNGGASIMSKKQGLVYIPVRGWQFADGNGGWGWEDDTTLTITGKLSEFEIISLISMYLQKENHLILRH